jgi:hypothetical protein
LSYGLGVERRTRRRVLLDTTPRRLGRFLALAVVLHVPLTPVAGLFGLLRFFSTETEAPVLPPVTEIPLDLIDDDTPPAAKPGDTPEGKEPESAAEAALPPEPEAALPKPKPKPKPLPDAGAADAESDKPDAGAPDASKTSDAGAADAGPSDAGPAHKPGEGIGDPVAGLGDKRVVDPNANVRVLVFNDRVRKHPLGGRVGPLLRSVYQWRDFFGPTTIDPVKDIDRMMLVGPQLRDSRDVVAILQFNIPQERVRAAIDTLVARDPDGAWLDGPVPVARAHADRGERAFVLPSPKLLIVTPPSALESAKKFKRAQLPAPKEEEIAIGYLSTPWRAFLGLPVVIPKSIDSARLRLSPMPDGGIVIDILAHDQTEPLAVADAQALTAALTAATSLDLGLFGSVLFGSSRKKFIEKGSFEADGLDIRGEIVLTRSQTETLLDLAGSFLAGRAPRPRPAPSAVPTAPPSEPSTAATTPTAPPTTAPEN